MSGNLRSGVQTSFAEIGKILGDTEKRATDMAEAMRTSISAAAKDASASVESTLAKANESAEEVASRLRGSVSSSLADVDRLLGETGKRSSATAVQLRDALKEAIDEAVGRFAGATDEIRRTAGEIRKELTDTRAELKRGAFDLPEEAKENAAQMRRAVAEQVRALQELTGIIGVSASHLESPRAIRQEPVRQEPVRQEPTRQEPVPPRREPEVTVRQAEPVAVVLEDIKPAVIVERPKRSEQPVAEQRVEQRQATAERQPQEPVGLRGTLGIDRAQPAQPQPREAARPAASPAITPRREEASSQQGQGWISDLLRNASRDDEEQARPAASAQTAARPDSRNPRHVVESLNSLSVDIARAIDHDASVELWRRYQRGERDVFTRRLYTLKGQQTFDEIKRKYDREPEFRAAVDRYIGDFEKLLADVARNDRDKALTQSYLTSDTGKVYTMLAHAAGRFS
jgi:hypothetical protein